MAAVREGPISGPGMSSRLPGQRAAIRFTVAAPRTTMYKGRSTNVMSGRWRRRPKAYFVDELFSNTCCMMLVCFEMYDEISMV